MAAGAGAAPTTAPPRVVPAGGACAWLGRTHAAASPEQVAKAGTRSSVDSTPPAVAGAPLLGAAAAAVASAHTPAGMALTAPSSERSRAGPTLGTPSPEHPPAGMELAAPSSKPSRAGPALGTPSPEHPPAAMELAAPSSQHLLAGMALAMPSSERLPAGMALGGRSLERLPAGMAMAAPLSLTPPAGMASGVPSSEFPTAGMAPGAPPTAQASEAGTCSSAAGASCKAPLATPGAPLPGAVATSLARSLVCGSRLASARWKYMAPPLGITADAGAYSLAGSSLPNAAGPTCGPPWDDVAAGAEATSLASEARRSDSEGLACRTAGAIVHAARPCGEPSQSSCFGCPAPRALAAPHWAVAAAAVHAPASSADLPATATLSVSARPAAAHEAVRDLP
eukprot:362814-Chlamydomonas_euryale.AAC.8